MSPRPTIPLRRPARPRAVAPGGPPHPAVPRTSGCRWAAGCPCCWWTPRRWPSGASTCTRPSSAASCRWGCSSRPPRSPRLRPGPRGTGPGVAPTTGTSSPCCPASSRRGYGEQTRRPTGRRSPRRQRGGGRRCNGERRRRMRRGGPTRRCGGIRPSTPRVAHNLRPPRPPTAVPTCACASPAACRRGGGGRLPGARGIGAAGPRGGGGGGPRLAG